jgi:hypothetical protein
MWKEKVRTHKIAKEKLGEVDKRKFDVGFFFRKINIFLFLFVYSLL